MKIYREPIIIKRYEIVKDEDYDFIVFSQDRHVLATIKSNTPSFVEVIDKYLKTNRKTIDAFNIYLEE